MKNYTFKLGIFEGDKELYQGNLSYEEVMSLVSTSFDGENLISIFFDNPFCCVLIASTT